MDAATAVPQELEKSTPEAQPQVAPETQSQPQPDVAYSEYLSVVIERNFLQRGLADLNFHNNAQDGIVFTDKENRFVYANPYFLTMMGIADPKELLNKPLPAYMWGNKPEQEGALFRDVQSCGFVRE